MLDFLKRLLGFSAKPVEVAPEPNQVAPYKVPEPVATTPIPLVVTNSNPADNAPVVAKTTPAKPKAAARTATPKAPSRTATSKTPATPKAKAPAKKAPRQPKMTVAK
jgi:hypothetical protein